jgi:heptosyltransferase II
MGVSPSILVIRLSSLGDVVLSTSVPAALKSKFPEARVVFLTKEAFVDVLRNNPNIDRPICLSAGESSLKGLLGIARKLRAERFDLIIDLQANPRTVLLCALIGCRKCSRAGRDSLVRHGMVRFKSLLSRRSRHAVQRYLSAVQKSFGPVPALKPRIFVTEAEQETAAQLLRSSEGFDGSPIVAICPGARWKTKLWGADRMSLLAHKLVQTGHAVVVLGGSADESILEEMKQLCRDLDAVRFHSGNLRSVGALMSQSCCVVSNDSGLMHMAYSVGTPVVAVFGSTTPEFGFYPPDSQSTVISKSFRCKPCDVHGRDECKKGDMRCMVSVEVSEVLDAVEATLKRVSSGGLQVAPHGNASERESPPIELPRFLIEEAEPELSGSGWSVPELGPVVVRVPNWVGDLVMAYPSLAALRRCTQGMRLVAVAHGRVASLLEDVALLDEVIVLNNQMGLGLLKTALALRGRGFTLGIAMPDSFSSAFLLWLGGVKRIVGFRAEMRDVFLSTRLSRKKWSHLSEQYAQFLPRACKIDGKFVLTLGQRDISRARELLEGAGIPESSTLVLVAPGASYGETKRWPEESYTRLVGLLKTKARSHVVLVGNAADRELCARIAEKSGRSTANLAGQTTLRDLAAIASIASVFIGNDSGAAHVAAAAGCPVVAIFGSSDPSWTAPRGDDVRVIYKKLSCSPCFLKKCPYELQCLSQIDAGEVYGAVVEIAKQERLDSHGGNS